jgi:hypothetical protein
MYVAANCDFITLSDLFDAKDYNRHILSYRSGFADTASGNNDRAR